MPKKDLHVWKSDECEDYEDDGGFSQTGVETIKSSSGSSVGLHALGMESHHEPDLWEPVKCEDDETLESTGNINQRVKTVNSSEAAIEYGYNAIPSSRPHCDLRTLLSEIGLSKYASIFEEQDVDFDMFLTLTDNDLREIGIKCVFFHRFTSVYA